MSKDIGEKNLNPNWNRSQIQTNDLYLAFCFLPHWFCFGFSICFSLASVFWFVLASALIWLQLLTCFMSLFSPTPLQTRISPSNFIFLHIPSYFLHKVLGLRKNPISHPMGSEPQKKSKLSHNMDIKHVFVAGTWTGILPPPPPFTDNLVFFRSSHDTELKFYWVNPWLLWKGSFMF